MKLAKVLLVAMSALSLMACDSRETVYVEPHSDEDYGPALYGFYLVDSYLVDTEFDYSTPLKLDPRIDEGIFDINWEVESRDDYYVRVKASDSPSMNGGVTVGSALCGQGLPCEEDGHFYCIYTLDFAIGCGFDVVEAEENLRGVDTLIDVSRLPQKIFLNFEVCADQGGCESSSIEVSLY